jgi:precorrin-6A/cobalt-precorrin-6A reductase
MKVKRILILGGTGEARALATRLNGEGYDVIMSLAGVTKEPLLPEGRIRRGGFGGVDGLAKFLREEAIACLIDATHPFAAQMSGHALEAAREAGVPMLRLERPAWQADAGDRWTNVASVELALLALPPGARAFVTIGRKEIAAFLARDDIGGIARMIEPPSSPVPRNWTVMLQRPPFTEAAEFETLSRQGITHVVAKNAGGSDTFAKIVAARRMRIPVVMIARPGKPEVPCFASVNEIFPAILQVLLP